MTNGAARWALAAGGAVWLLGGVAAEAATVTAPIDFSACANVVGNFFSAAPVGLIAGNAGTSYATKVKFNLLDPSKGNNIWYGATGGSSLHIKLSVPSPAGVFALLNTFYGQSGVNNARVQFKGTNGTLRSFQLIGNVTIRDYNNWVWTDTINNTSTEEWWTNNLTPTQNDQSHRMDAHWFPLAATFTGQTLTDIILTAPKGAGVNAMQPALFALDVKFTPMAGGSKTVASTCTAH